MSKGSTRRKQQISEMDMQERWNMIFNSPYRKHWKKTKKRVVSDVKKIKKD
jgi:hypothetical protein